MTSINIGLSNDEIVNLSKEFTKAATDATSGLAVDITLYGRMNTGNEECIISISNDDMHDATDAGLTILVDIEE